VKLRIPLAATTTPLSLALWCRAKDGSTTYINSAFQTLFAVDAEELTRDPQMWLAAVHAEDRARVVEAGAERDGLEYRVVDADGTVRQVRERVYAVFDDQGGTNGTASVVEDLTHQRARAAVLDHALGVEARARTAAEVAHQLDEALAAVAWLTERLHIDELTAPIHERISAVERLVEYSRELVAKLHGTPHEAASAVRSPRGSSK